MQNFLKKLTSRKFLAALAGVATGLAMVFGDIVPEHMGRLLSDMIVKEI